MTTQRLADRITAIVGSADFSGFTPFLSPLMFFFDKSPWPTLALVVSLAAILLTTLVMVEAGDSRTRVPVNTRVCRAWMATLRHEFATLLRGADCGRVHL